MPASKKILLLFLSSVFFFHCRINAQPTDSLVSPHEIALYRNQIDSMSELIRLGIMQKDNRPCLLPEHLAYHRQIPDYVISLATEALSLPERKKDAYALVLALKFKGTLLYEKRDYIGSFRMYQEGLVVALANGFTYEELHGLRPALNNGCFLSGNYEMAMKISTDGLTNAEKINDEKQAAHFNNVIGYIHMKQGNFLESDKYYKRYLGFTRKVKDTLSEAHALTNMADLASAQKEYDLALEYLDRSLASYESVKSTGLFNLPDKRGFVANKKAEVYKLKGEYQKALPFVHYALNVLKTDSSFINDYDEASYFVNAGDIYNRMLMPDSAIYYLQRGLEVSTRIIHREHMRDVYEQLSIAYELKHDFENAYVFKNLYSHLKDDIAAESNQREIYQRETELRVKQQQQLQERVMWRQRLIRNISLMIAGLILVTAGFLYTRNRLNKKTRYQKELNRQQVELFNAIAVTQEQERKRIAQDIHDSLGSVLSAAKLKLAEARELKPELAGHEQFITGLNLIDEASAELRSISHNIMPATLSKLGLVPALKNLSEKISSNKGLQVKFGAHEFDSRIEEQTEISIYRVILELINNIVKHAAATQATVQLIKYPDHINITVEDNGKGFDPVKILHEKKGIGLGNIYSRVDYLKGTINIDAGEGRGTTVIIDIPLES